MKTTENLLEDIMNSMIEGIIERNNTSISEYDMYEEYEKVEEGVYYDTEEDKYVCIINYGDMDSMIEEGITEEAAEELYYEYLCQKYDRYKLEEYNNYEYYRNYVVRDKEGMWWDMYYQYGVGKVYLSKE